jgi:hypothetical protein
MLGTSIVVCPSERQTTMPEQEYAVFTELSPDNKLVTPDFNTRVFTDVDS